jgi:hypothetical protein
LSAFGYNRELRNYIQSRFGLSPDDYTAAQLRYDLMKLRAKGLIRKLERIFWLITDS